MIRTLLVAAALGFAAAAPVHAAEPILGKWKTASGSTAEIAACGTAFCVTLKTGKHAGKRVGSLSGTGGSYSGVVTDPESDKTYSGTGSVDGNLLKMRGCVLKVLCKSQTWTRL
ncbi:MULTISPECIES: DUF2147 domain-containing protein [Sinorhizobium]|jgi:uncharacterized protein (DUF2147 family)|uniref:DUF2147 domain-containing protein n=1 Tax=Sinorhizobium TaxID=28105 RepID=UPI00035FB61E|nr:MULTISPECIES: DUF2147 domain-containing protein [Sinorhizobium]PND20968.1 DUF2147 domain-containing protein [Ensifer sp. MMN_5]MCG5482920.1 DUF2147 domain-containing protein [Sinorhizobium meliloti]PND28125.1 DUF2147 domain-containing protein [Sinorhizobium sp. M4_45]RVP96553.1 DUF2147 domain-containing protein [Sinorhizobium meliloti]WEJ10995.1 DUF2147 domain-containing protein [Sinorhizobium sp. M103]